jgi:hypothetical protein
MLRRAFEWSGERGPLGPQQRANAQRRALVLAWVWGNRVRWEGALVLILRSCALFLSNDQWPILNY